MCGHCLGRLHVKVDLDLVLVRVGLLILKVIFLRLQELAELVWLHPEFFELLFIISGVEVVIFLHFWGRLEILLLLLLALVGRCIKIEMTSGKQLFEEVRLVRLCIRLVYLWNLYRLLTDPLRKFASSRLLWMHCSIFVVDLYIGHATRIAGNLDLLWVQLV